MNTDTNSLAAIALQSIKSKIDNRVIEQMKVATENKIGNFEYYNKFIDYFNSFVHNTNVFIEDVLKPKYAQSDINISIDFFFTDSPQAFTLYVKEDRSYAIGIDFRYIILIQEAGFAAIDAVSTGSINKTVSREAAIGFLIVLQNNINRINGIVNDRILKNANNYLEYQRKRRHWNEITQTLTFFTSWFVIAHEFGHIVLDHFDGEDSSLFHKLDSNTKADEISTFAHKKEYDADKWAFKCLQNEFLKQDFLENYEQMTPLIFFTIYDIIQSMFNRNSSISTHVTTSHPTWRNRYNNIKKLQLPNRKEEYKYLDNIITPLEMTPDFIHSMKEIILSNPLQ